jgi:hypothetical protein
VASVGYVRALLGGLPETTKRVFVQVFEHVLGNLRFGPVEHQTRAENHQIYHLSSTTASDTGEFSILHGLPQAPHLVLQTLDPSLPGAQTVVLEIARAADSKRLYLKAKAGSTNAPFSLLVE